MANYTHLDTPLGRLSIHTFTSADAIGQLSLDPQFGEHCGSGSLDVKRETLMKRAAEEDTNVVLAVTDEEKIVGYCILASAKLHLRWSAVDSSAVKELDFVEVARGWRGMGIGKKLLKAALSCPGIEERILYALGYRWTWDMEGMNMTVPEYRRMLLRLVEPFQFSEHETNEFNVLQDVNNFFVCRIGKNIDGSLLEDFKWVSISHGYPELSMMP